jgi:hypothetical protein
MIWQSPNINGWWPRLSPDGTQVLHGTGGQAFVSTWRTGASYELLAGENRVYPMGWRGLDPLWALVPPRPVEEPVVIDGGEYPAMNRFDARGGSWCAGRAEGNQVWWDGDKLAAPGGWRCRCDGGLVTVATKGGIVVWGRAAMVIDCGELRDHTLRGTVVGYAINRRTYMHDLAVGVSILVDAAPGPESTPCIVDGWVWSVAEHIGPQDETYIQGHPSNQQRVIASKRPKGSQDWIDVVHINGEWIVASCHDGGILVVESISDRTSLRTWNEIINGVPPTPPEPPMPETPNHLDTVIAVRAQYPTNENLGNERAFRITNEVAWRHRDEGFGLRKKPDGNNYLGYAVDIVFHKSTIQFVDVLGSSETLGTPQWSEVSGAIIREWAPPLDPATLEPDPPDPPPTTLETRVLALEEDLMKLREALTSWIIK